MRMRVYEVNDQDVTVLIFTIEGEEVLRISPEGFSVSGRRLDLGDLEAHDREVYRALKHFLANVERRPFPRKGLTF